MGSAEFDAGLVLADELIREGAGDESVVVAKAVCLLQLGRRRDALGFARSAYRKDGESAAALAYVAALAAAELGQTTTSAKWLRRAVAANPMLLGEALAQPVFGPVVAADGLGLLDAARARSRAGLDGYA